MRASVILSAFSCLVLCLASNKPSRPKCDSCVFVEDFESDISGRWIASKSEKYTAEAVVSARDDAGEVVGDHGLLLPTSHRFYGMSTKLSNAVSLKDTFVVQYEVALLDRLDCGGAYLKLLTATESFRPETLNNDSPYSIMFGPDKCGSTNKIHVIFRHENPITKVVEEKHLKSPPTFPNDKIAHLYTLVIRSDNTYDVLVDNVSTKSGSLFEDFEPPFQPPKLIDDPTDVKPEDWVDDAQIPDPTATKPDDWDEDAPLTIEDPNAVKPAGWLDDESEYIPDPNAVKPADWDDSEDGDFEAPIIPNPACSVGCGEWKRPTIQNPEYKGKWSAPLIDNPDFKGVWAPKQIDNPAYYEEKSPSNFSPIGAIAFELWTTNKNILFDNVLIADSTGAASAFAGQTWAKRHEVELAAARKEAAENEGFLGQAFEFVQDNFLVVIVGLCLVLLVIVRLCLARTPEPDADTEHKDDDDAAQPQDDQEVDSEPETKSEHKDKTPEHKDKDKTPEHKEKTPEVKATEVKADPREEEDEIAEQAPAAETKPKKKQGKKKD